MIEPKAGRVTSKLVERKVGDLWIDPNVQRALQKGRVTRMAAEFNPDALGVLTTSYRGPQRIATVDGQHRYRAAEAAQYQGVLITKEYHGLTIQEEAALFRLLNTAQKPSAVDKFLVACVEQVPSAVAIAAFLTANGWTVGAYSGEGRITAIGSLERVYSLSADAASAAIAVLTQAYGHRPAAVQGSLVEGLGRLIARYGVAAIDLDDLAKRLAGIPGGPDGLVGNARGQALTRTGNLSTQVARVIHSLYNQRRRTTALPPWE